MSEHSESPVDPVQFASDYELRFEPQNESHVYDRECEGYKSYLAARSRSLAYLQACSDSIDKWLLSLSGGGLVYATASGVSIESIGPIYRIILVLSVLMFVLAIFFAMASKGIAYRYAFKRDAKIHQLAESKDFYDFAEKLNNATRTTAQRIRPLLYWINVAAFGSFMIGLMLVLVFGFNSAKGFPATTKSTEDLHAKQTEVSATPTSTPADSTAAPPESAGKTNRADSPTGSEAATETAVSGQVEDQ